MQWVSSSEKRPTDASNRMANHQLNKEDPPLTGLAGFYVYFVKALLPCVAAFCPDSHAVKDRFYKDAAGNFLLSKACLMVSVISILAWIVECFI